MRAVHGRRGKGTEGGKPEPMPRIGSFDLPDGSAAAALHDGADPTSCDWLIPGLVPGYPHCLLPPASFVSHYRRHCLLCRLRQAMHVILFFTKSEVIILLSQNCFK